MGLYILGTGGLGEELCALAEDMNRPVEAFVKNLDREKDGGKTLIHTAQGRPSRLESNRLRADSMDRSSFQWG
jgi:hypothetical protein